MRKLIGITTFVAIAALSLTGCSPYYPHDEEEASTPVSVQSSGAGAAPSSVVDFEYTTSSGVKLTCVWAEGYQKGGLWCMPQAEVDR